MVDAQPAAAKGNGKHLLIIEDEEALATALQLKFSSAGFVVTVMLNGQDGLNTALSGSFDMILLDLILPLMDGFTVLEKLHEHGNKTPVIVLSNLSQAEDLEKAKKLGALDYLVKSDIQLSKVLEYVLKIVG
jgi:DNA-binding response OmpR family regulator